MPESPWLRVKPPAARLVIHGDAASRAAASVVWGVPFSEKNCRACTLATNATRATLWLGPDEYLMWQASRDEALPIDALERALAPHPHALVDISHRQAALEVSGPRATTTLAGACPLDLDLRQFPVDMCTRTLLAKADIVLWRTAPEVFHIEVWRSYQAYAEALLREIAGD